MNRRSIILGLVAATVGLPAIAAEPAQRRSRTTSGSGGGTSGAKPGVAERANRRVGRATESTTAAKAKKRTAAGDAAMKRVLGRSR